MNNSEVEDPNEEVREVAERARKENAVHQLASKARQEQEEALLRLSDDEKIEYYYRLLDVDSLDSYRLKLTSLNLPIFQNKERSVTGSQHGKALS